MPIGRLGIEKTPSLLVTALETTPVRVVFRASRRAGDDGARRVDDRSRECLRRPALREGVDAGRAAREDEKDT